MNENKDLGAAPSGPAGNDAPASGAHGGSKDDAKDGGTAGGGHVNPSAPEDSNTTPGSTVEK